MADLLRLSKRMADLGICSRREADQLIEKGLVLVNGLVVDKLGSKVTTDDKVELLSAAKTQLGKKATILLNKPIGFVSSATDEGYTMAVKLIIPENQSPLDKSGKRLTRDHYDGLAPAGRLDIDSKGLIILTQDGTVARKVIGPDSEIEKEYLVWVEGQINDKRLESLRHGLQLDGRNLKPATIERMGDACLKFILKEGRKRQVRRMCELVGLKATGLKRVRVGNVRLGDLKSGQWRFLSRGEEF